MNRHLAPETGDAQWYLYDLATRISLKYAPEIVDFIRATPDTERHCEIEESSLKGVRETIDKHIKTPTSRRSRRHPRRGRR